MVFNVLFSTEAGPVLRDGKCFRMQMGGGGPGRVWHFPSSASEHAGPVNAVKDRSSLLLSPLHIKQVLCKYAVITIHHK